MLDINFTGSALRGLLIGQKKNNHSNLEWPDRFLYLKAFPYA